ncbi:hypothetical protein ABPG73_004529 [Tetrahymena malaccensis]
MKSYQILIFLLNLAIQAYCQSPKCSNQQCTSPGSSDCKSPNYNQCINDNLDCTDYNINDPVGRKLNDFQCIKNNVTISDSNVQCWNSTDYQICINKPENECINFALETDLQSIYAGLLNNTNRDQSLFKCIYPDDKVDIDQVISLRIPFCVDNSTSIIKNLTQKLDDYVGIDQKYFQCLQMNKTAYSSVSFCSQGYCSFNNTCTQISKYLPAKLRNFQCAQINTYQSIECYKDTPFTIQSICFDPVNQICTQIVDFSYYNLGILPNGNCVQQQKVYDEITLCSDQSCLLKVGNGFSCIPFDNVYVGVDSKGFCLKRGEKTAVRCRKIKFCIEQIDITCVDLTNDQLDRVARETNTTNCLTQSDSIGQNIEMCADGYCLYSSSQDKNSDYCILYGGSLNLPSQTVGPFIGVESITERCLTEGQQVNSIMLCYSLKYCILPVNNKQTCQMLFYPFSYDFVNPTQYNYAAKNANGYCQSTNQANSISCAGPQLCLQGDQCVSLNDSSYQSSSYVGRDANSQICIGSRSYFASYCKLNYCLIQNQCVELDSLYVGREYLSSKCLLNGQIANQKIKQCIEGYCIKQVNPSSYSCILLDYDQSKNALGYNSDMECLGANQPVAIKCYPGQSCLLGNTCQYVDPLVDNKCSQNGRCADPQSGQCKICPLKTCLDQKSGKCIAFKDMPVKENECIIQIRPDKPCQFMDMNNYKDDTSLYCADEDNVCVIQSFGNMSLKCLRCPTNFINIGDRQCLTMQQRDTSQKQSIDTTFSLNIIYVQEGTCQGTICNTLQITKCPTGCYSCKDLNFCTQCIEGYFLYKNQSDQSVQCVQCDYLYSTLNQYPDTYRIAEGTTQISQKCLDCSLETGVWNNNLILSKVCQQIILKFTINQTKNLVLIENKPPFALSYTITLNSSQNTFYSNYKITKNNKYVQNVSQVITQINKVNVNNVKVGAYSVSQDFQIAKESNFIIMKLVRSNDKAQVQQAQFQCARIVNLHILFLIIQQHAIIVEKIVLHAHMLIKIVTLTLVKLTIFSQHKIIINLIIYLNNVTAVHLALKLNHQMVNNLFINLNLLINKLGFDCGASIQFCALHSLINKATGQVNLVYDLSYYGESGSTKDSSLICISCSYQYILSGDKKFCKQNYDVKDVNCLQFQNDNASCKLCKEFALNYDTKKCDVNFKCLQSISGCDKCLYQYYKDQQQVQQIYFTCLQCSQDNYMVTFLGCVQCQQGCSRCYEIGYDSQKQRFNITAHIMYEDFSYDIDSRLNYKKLLNVQTFCSSCLDGYYFEPIQKICIPYPCGQLCNNCIFKLNRFFCLDCNQTAVLQQIQPIQLFMGNFFFGQNFISQQIQISTFTGDQKSCQACPYLCESCDQTNNLFKNSYSIYQTQCFSCKTIQQLQVNSQAFQSYFQGYEIRFDKKRFACTLCKIGDQSCYFKKITKLYVNCAKISNNNVGDGTRQIPFNINMISEIADFDNLILGENNPNFALVALNEISLKELELQLIFSQEQSQCQLLKPLQIKTNLLQKIQSIDVLHLNITYEQVNNKQFPFLQMYPTIIQGFTNVSISNMNIDSYSPYFDQFKIGFQISSTNLKQVYLNNLKFQRGLNGPQNVLNIFISNLINNLILEKITFENLQYYQSSAIQLFYSQNQIITDFQIFLDSINISKEVPAKISSCAYFEALIGNIELIDSKFINNFSVQKSNCLIINTKQFTINNSIFENYDSNIDFSNTTVLGGFIQSFTQQANIINTHFEGGRALKGGAIYLVFDIIGYLNIQDCSFVSNLSLNLFINENQGGAIYIDSQLCGLQVEIVSTSFLSNTAYNQGGVLFVQNSQFKKFISVVQSEFIDNFSQEGSLMYLNFQSKYKNVFLMTDSLFSYNPVHFQQNTLKKHINNYFQADNFNFQQLLLNGFIEINLINNKFIMENLQYDSAVQAYYGMKTLFQVSNTQYFKDLNSLYQNINYQVSLIQLLDILQINIQNTQFDSIISQIAKTFIQITSNFTYIQESKFNNNKCLACNKGLVQLNSYYLIILKSDFGLNQVQDKGVLYISQIKNTIPNQDLRFLQEIPDLYYPFYISFVSFINNFSQKSSGAVYVDSSSASFFNCSFIYNKASQGNGGAIYYKGLEQITNIKIQNSLFFYNQAQIGGAIFSESGQAVQNLYTKNIFQSNVANLFSSNTYQYPHHMIPIQNGTQPKNNTVIHSSGKFSDDLVIQFMTQQNEFYIEHQGNITLNILLNDTSYAYLSSQQIIQKSGSFKLNQLNLNGIFGLTVKLTFSSDLIKSPVYDQITGEIISYNNDNRTFDLTVKFVEGCELGYQHVKDQKFDYCQRCNNPFYNTFPGQKCIKCPNYGICDGYMIYIQEGYWRLNLNSSDFYQCKSDANSCSGDLDIYKSKCKITRNSDIRYCRKGFVGPLCSDCDIYGRYWKGSYVQDGNLGCINCSQSGSSIWLFVLIVFANSLLTLYMVNSYLGQVAQNIQMKILYIMKIYTSRNIQLTSFYIKLITSYLQIFMIVSDIIKAQLQNYQNFFNFASDPNKKALLSLDCSLTEFYKSENISFIFIKIILGQLTIVSYVVFFIVFYLIQRIIRKQKIVLIDIFSGINFIYLVSQPSVVQQLIGSALCVDQYGLIFVKNFPSVQCDKQLYLHRTMIIFTLMLIWAVLVPLFLLYNLRKIKYHLNQLNNLKLFGIFYFDFKEQFYYWELIKISLKSHHYFAFYCWCTHCQQNNVNFISFSDQNVNSFLDQPNSNQTLNYIEELVYILCSISIGLCAYLSDNQIVQDQQSKDIAFSFLIIINLFSVGILIKNIVVIVLKEQLTKSSNLVEKKLQNWPRLKSILKKIGYIDRNRILKLWKNLRKLVQSISKYAFSNNIYANTEHK